LAWVASLKGKVGEFEGFPQGGVTLYLSTEVSAEKEFQAFAGVGGDHGAVPAGTETFGLGENEVPEETSVDKVDSFTHWV